MSFSTSSKYILLIKSPSLAVDALSVWSCVVVLVWSCFVELFLLWSCVVVFGVECETQVFLSFKRACFYMSQYSESIIRREVLAHLHR